MKHRKPNPMTAKGSLSLATAAVVASLMSTTASAAPVDPEAVPTSPGQPGVTPTPAPGAGPQTSPAPQPSPSQPGVKDPESRSESDPNATAPEREGGQPGNTGPNSTSPGNPTQPGVTTPRQAPLPVPGQPQSVTPESAEPPSDPAGESRTDQPAPASPGERGGRSTETPHDEAREAPVEVVPVAPRWTPPSVTSAPPAPTVVMTGPHTEVGASVDGGTVLTGYAANTHHFSNLDGYVGTVGYRLPGGSGEAGLSLDFTVADQIKVVVFVKGAGAEDRVNEFVVDTAQANLIKATAEGWVRLQPGGEALLAEVARLTTLPEGEMPTQTVEVGDLSAQVGGSVEH